MAEEIIEEEPTIEIPQEESEESETPDQSEEEEISNEVEVKSERGQKRVQELANKASQLEKEKEELKQKLADLEPLVAPKQQADPLKELEDFTPKLTGDYESDIKTVEERATKKAIDQVQREQLKRDQLVSDVLACEDAYPELKKGSESYDEKLSNEVVAFYNEIKAVNPEVRLKPVVDRLMRLKGYTAEKSKAEVAQNLKQQFNEGAVTPSTTVQVEKDPKEMSLSEIEKQVGIVQDY